MLLGSLGSFLGGGQGMHGMGCGRQGDSQVETDGDAEEKGWSRVSDVEVQPFSMNDRPTFPLEEPAAIFSARFTPQLHDQIVVETNQYATLCLTSTHSLVPRPEKGEERGPGFSRLCMRLITVEFHRLRILLI